MIVKIKRDRVEVEVVVPDWQTQYSYQKAVNMEKQTLIYFWPSLTNSMLPQQAEGVAPITQ